MRKGSALPLITVAIFILGGLTYLFIILTHPQPKQQEATTSASPDQYQDWNTYTNKTYGFSLRFPQKWSVKQTGDYSADFYSYYPNSPEATPGAAQIRFLRLSETVDLNEFNKIYKLDEGSQFAEQLDVHSLITKNQNSTLGSFPAIDFVIDRAFSALEGPRGEFIHVYEINKEGTILKFQSRSDNKEQQLRLSDPTFSQIISSIKF